jgi:hypothetical protein
MKRLIPVLFFAFCFGSVLAAEGPASVAELFVTPENLRVVREADKVDVCILNHIAPTVLANGRIDWDSERYEDTAFTPVPAATATTLRDLVLDEKTYDWKATGGRRPQLYLRLRFHRGAEVVALDFCFVCHVLLAHRNGTELGHANFLPNSDLFLQTFLKVFPDDAPLKHVAREAGLPL